MLKAEANDNIDLKALSPEDDLPMPREFESPGPVFFEPRADLARKCRLWIMLTFLCSLAAVPCRTGRAEDKVVLQPSGRFSSRIIVRGEVEDYTGEAVRIRQKAGVPVKSYPASEVLEVETTQTVPHQQGLKLMQEKRYAEATEALQTALVQEQRVWVRREILAPLIQCAFQLGDYPVAGMRYATLLRSDPTTRHFHLMPLAWHTQELRGSLRSDAIQWMDNSLEPLRLMGASFLFQDDSMYDAALLTLKDLSSSTDRRIQLLAQAQTWRERLTGDEISKRELTRWQTRLELLPPTLRGGPYYLLGQAYLEHHEHELAALAFLWIPLIADQDPGFAARASLEAAQALEAIGQKTNAATIYREIVQRFPATSYAQEAAAWLEQTVSSPSTS